TTVPRFAMPRPSARAPAPPTTPPSSFKVDSPADADILVLPGATPAAARPSVAPTPQVALPRVHPLSHDVVGRLVDEHGYGGVLLATVRGRLGLSVKDVADHTRISVRYLEALESEARDQLPSATFVRGYVREVARVLQLDADAVVAGYMRRYEGQ
ncbi:MAG: helix-turn-helix domain-containing protein, partial [Myxococcales bacterium]|nr:helix-turn-helix domain-containing protein [Myxococcales bacterium]